MSSMNRIKRELELLKKDPPANCSAGLIRDTDYYEWEASIIGPSDSPYEGGISITGKFSIRLSICLRCIFKTKIFHPNTIQVVGFVLDILKDSWSPALTMSKVLLSICSLMDDPNPDDPLVPSIAKMYKNNREKYNEEARNWTLLYAN